MWELNYKESWALKNWCFWTVVLEKTLESHLDGKEIQPVHSEGDQSWVFTGRTDAEAETPILRPPDVKNWLIWKDPDAGKDWGQEEKGMAEDEMVGWHHWLNGHEFEQALRDGATVPGVAKSDMTEQLNSNNDLINHSYNEVFIKPSRDGAQRASQLMSPWRFGESSILGRAWKLHNLSPYVALCISSIWLLSYIFFFFLNKLVIY